MEKGLTGESELPIKACPMAKPTDQQGSYRGPRRLGCMAGRALGPGWVAQYPGHHVTPW
jgi:hypothetical protein